MLTKIFLQYLDNPATIRKSPEPSRFWTQQFNNLVLQPFFSLLSLCSSDLYFSFSVFASWISTVFAIYAIRYRCFASVNFVANLRRNSCFAAQFLFQLLPSVCFGLFLGVFEGRIAFAVCPVLWQERRLRCVGGPN